MSRYLACLMFLASPLLAQDVRYSAAPAEVTEKLRNDLVEAFNAVVPLRSGKLFDEVVLCGPNLWTQLRADMSTGDDWAIDMQLFSDVPERAAAWGLVPARDLETDPEKRRVMRETERITGKVAFLGGAVRNEGPRVLGGLLAQRLTTPSRKLVRDARMEELQYEWLWIGWDLDGPIFVVCDGSARYLVDIDDGKISWIDLLPESVSSEQ